MHSRDLLTAAADRASRPTFRLNLNAQRPTHSITDASVDFLSLRLNNSTLVRGTSANAPGTPAAPRPPSTPFPR